MRIINFSHPLNPEQSQQLSALLGVEPQEVIAAMPQFDEHAPLSPQITTLIDSLGLSAYEWQTEALLILVPGLAVAAACLLAELHGRMGYFPAVVRLAARPNSPVRQYDVAEVLDLAGVREAAPKAYLSELGGEHLVYLEVR